MTEPVPECRDCDGKGWTVGADPLSSGEPGEPYQVQCWSCDGSGRISAGDLASMQDEPPSTTAEARP